MLIIFQFLTRIKKRGALFHSVKNERNHNTLSGWYVLPGSLLPGVAFDMPVEYAGFWAPIVAPAPEHNLPSVGPCMPPAKRARARFPPCEVSKILISVYLCPRA